MATQINIKHTQSGMVKTGFYGYSWVLDGSDSDKVLAGTALGISTHNNN